MSFASITEKQREFVYKCLNVDEHSLKSKVEQMKEWLSKQPHMPTIPEKDVNELLSNFLKGTKMNTEIAKRKLDCFYESRHRMPEVFSNPDPNLQSVSDGLMKLRMLVLPDLTPECARVVIIQLRTKEGQKLTNEDLIASMQSGFNAYYVRFTKMQDCFAEEILIFDVKPFRLSYLTDISWSLFLKAVTLMQEGIPVRIKAIFVINAPPVFQTLANMIKAVLNEKMSNRFHVWSGDHTELYKFIPREILPVDYGGNAPSIDVLADAWLEHIKSYRDDILEEQKLLTDETKRPPGTNSRAETFGLNGTFTRINID